MSETLLYGKNLCNILAVKVINTFNDLDKNHFTEIKIVNLGQFLVIKGITTIQTSVNYSELFSSYIMDKFNLKMTFNIIDLVEYNSTHKLNMVDINITIKTDDLLTPPMSLNSNGFYHIDTNKQLIKYSNSSLLDELLSYAEYKDYDGLYVKDTSVYVSDDLFGMSLLPNKLYIIFLRYISHNIFEKQLCKDLTFSLFYTGKIEELNWENIEFNVSSNSSIVSDKWLNSLILDIFDFNYFNIKKHLSLDEYDFFNEITFKDRCWEKNDNVSEIILL